MADRDSVGWRSFLTNPLLLALLGVSLIPMGFMGMTSYRAASAALRQQAFHQLDTVNAVTAKAVERYFTSLRQELSVLAESGMCAESLRDFTAGLATLRADDKVNDKALAAARRDLESFYTGEFAAEFRRRSSDPVDLRPLCQALDDDSAYAQYVYIRNNPNPIGSKFLLDAADDDSAYTKCHAKYHPFFRGLVEKYGVADVFLIDGASGKVVYNVSKEADFGSSLREGPLASSSLGLAFLQAVSAGRRDAVAFGHFQRHLPSCNDPASFMAAPIYAGRTLVGAVAFQVPIDKVNAIVGETTGMGRTGETYAIGPDRLFRSDSRFTKEMGAKTTIINPDFKVDTPAVRAAIDEGKTARPQPRTIGVYRRSSPGGR
jgi:hypothetical protein